MNKKLKKIELSILVIIFILVSIWIVVSEDIGDPTVQYNQSQTNVIIGTSSTSPDNLNVQDENTFDINEYALSQVNVSSDQETGTIQKIASYITVSNWTCNDQEAGTQQFKGAYTIAITGDKVPSSNGIILTGWTNPANLYDDNGVRTTAGNVNILHWWGGFNPGVPTGRVTINGIKAVYQCSLSNVALNSYVNVTLSNDGGSSYTGTQYQAHPTTTTDTNFTLGSFTDLWGLTWTVANANNIRVRLNTTVHNTTARNTRGDVFWFNINYTQNNDESNKTYVTYTSIDGGDYQNVDRVRAIVQIDSYNPSASNSTYNNNIRPDIEVGIWNGASYTEGFYCNLNNSMGNELLNTTDYNCTITTVDATILNAWKTNGNRRVEIRGIWVDSNLTNTYDEINVTGVFAGVDAYNGTNDVEVNKTTTLYNDVYSFAVLPTITNVTVTINVSSYNNLGSTSRGNSNSDLWLEITTDGGSSWIEIGNMSVTGLGNFSKSTQNAAILSGWNTLTNRDIRINGNYIDGVNQTAYDEINWTDVWVRIDSIGNYSAEVEHNATGVVWYGTLNSINLSVNFTTNVTSIFNLTIYDFQNSNWVYSICNSGTATASIWYNWWCNATVNPSNYNSSDGKIRIRLNDTNHSGAALLKEDYVQYYVSYIPPPPTLGDRIETPSSPATYSTGSSYEFNVTVNDVVGVSDISKVLFEWTGSNSTAIIYSDVNTTARKYSVVKNDLVANPSGYSFKWFANNSGNIWGNVISSSYIINKAVPSLSIDFSSSPVTYPTQTTATCNKLTGDGSATITMYRNESQVNQSSGSSITEIIILGAGIWNYSCNYTASENFTTVSIKDQNLQVNKANNILSSLTCSPTSTVTYPTETTCTGSQTTTNDNDVIYYLYRNESLKNQQTNLNPSETATLGAEVYEYKFNSSVGENYSANSTGLTLVVTVNKNTSTLNFINLTINDTESNKIYTYPTFSNATGWFNSNAFVGPAPTLTLYRNTTEVGSTNPIKDEKQLAGSFYNYTYYTLGNQNYSSATKQFNLTINKAELLSYLHIAINETEIDASYIYENVTNDTGWSTLSEQNGITYNLYRNTSTASSSINSGSPVSDVIRLGVETYYYVYNTTGNENYTSGSTTRQLTITQKTPTNSLDLSPSSTVTYPTQTTATCTISSVNNEITAQLYRNSSATNPVNSGNPATEIITLGVKAHDYVCNNSATQNYTTSSNTSVLNVGKGNPSSYINMYIDNQTSDNSINYPAISEIRGNISTISGANDLIFNLYRLNTLLGLGNSTNQTVDSTRLGNATYTLIYNTTGGENWTSGSSATRTLYVSKGTAPIYLALNGTQGNVTYTYLNSSNATGWLTAINNEGSVELFRYGVSKGSGSLVTEEILLGVNEYNYSIIFAETENYSYNSITQDRFLKINRATPIATLTLTPSSPIVYGTNTNATCIENNPEANGNLWRNDTEVNSENNTEITLPAATWYYVCNVSQTENYTIASDSSYYTVNKALSNIRLFLDSIEDNQTYTYEDYANITATLDIAGKTFYVETNFSGINQIINEGTDKLENITNSFGAGYLNVTAYWNGDQNYTDDIQTYFMTVNKKPTTTYLWLNGSREDKYYSNNTVANLTVELLNYPGNQIELWTNYSNGVWKKWNSGNSPYVNFTQLTSTGVFNFTGNYSGNANYTDSYESWLVTVSMLSFEAKLESLSPTSINQSQNSTAVGNCSCTGGICNNVYMEIQADETMISNTSGNLQVNGSNSYYVGQLNNNFSSKSWNITGWQAGNYVIRIMCNSTETGDSFSTTQNLQVNDTTNPNWNNNATYPTSPIIYSTSQSYQFNITWTDNVDISKVLIEHNFTTSDGSLINDIMSNESSEYYFDFDNIKAGTFVWKIYANDTSGNSNQSDQWTYTINKASTLTRLFLNGNESNRNYNVTSISNFTTTLNVSGKNVYLQTNISGWNLQSGTTPLHNYTTLNQKGVFNITGYFSGDENYTASSQTYYITVEDLENPEWNNQGQNASLVEVNKTILLYSNWSDNFDLDYAWLSTNETGQWKNYTGNAVNINLTSDQTWSNFSWRNSSVPAGWTVGWKIYVNDTSDNENVTDIMTFFVNASGLWNYATAGPVYSSTAIGDLNGDSIIDVVFGSYDKGVYALMGNNGTKIWNFTTNGLVASSPSLANLTGSNYLDVAIGSYDHNMYLINGSSGNKLWNYSTNDVIFSSPAIYDVNNDTFLDIVFGSADNRTYALNGSNGVQTWNYTTDGKIFSSPAVNNISASSYPIVFIGSYDYNLYAINGSSGNKLWNFSASEKIESSPALGDINSDGLLEVAIGSYDNILYVINASNGQQLWNYTTGKWITSSPVITDIGVSKKIIVGSHDSNVYAFNYDGSIYWTFTIPTGGRIPSSPSIADYNLDGINDVIIGATDGRIYAINGLDGILLWSYNVGQYIFSSPSIADVNGDGTLDIAIGSLNKNQSLIDPPSWNLFGANQRRTRLFDNSKPVAVNYGYEFNNTHLIFYSNWKKAYSNIALAKIKENSTGDTKESEQQLKGMISEVNYTISKKDILENWNTKNKTKVIECFIEVYDEYENKESLDIIASVSLDGIDNIFPYWMNENAYPDSPIYNKNETYKFSIDWFDNADVSEVLIENNFTGHPVNYSANKIVDNSYEYSFYDLIGGSYYYKWYARDLVDNWNSTGSLSYVIEKVPTTTKIYLNGNEADRIYHYKETANITIVTNISDRIVENWNNLTGYRRWNYGREPLQDIIKMNYSLGNYNFSGIFSGDDNYTSSQSSHILSLFGYSEVSKSDMSKNIAKVNEPVRMKCLVVDSNTNIPIGRYPMNFYIDNVFLGNNFTDRSGVSYFTFKVSKPGLYTVKCNITNASDLFYDATSKNTKKELLLIRNSLQKMSMNGET